MLFKDDLIDILSKRAPERAGAGDTHTCLWAVRQPDGEPQSITPHSSAQSCLLCSVLLLHYWWKSLRPKPCTWSLRVCLQSHTSNQSNLDSAESKCHCCQTTLTQVLYYRLSASFWDEIINLQWRHSNQNKYLVACSSLLRRLRSMWTFSLPPSSPDLNWAGPTVYGCLALRSTSELPRVL